MLKSPLYRKYLIITLAVTLLFLCLGFMTSLLINQNRVRADRNPGLMVARLVNEISPNDPLKGVQQITRANQGRAFYKIYLIDENGLLLFPHDGKLPYEWKNIPRPDVPLQPAFWTSDGWGRPFHPSVIRLSGEPVRYLLVDHGDRTSPGKTFTVIFFTLVFSLILASALSVFILLYSLRGKVKAVDAVLSEFKRGNLKARFRSITNDEIGQAMSRFNQMADEIEKLVDQLKNTEQSRISLLQELAHDVRTPVASLKNLLETLLEKGNVLAPNVKDEFLSLALKEVDYFERLTEELLFLARVGGDAKAPKTYEPVDVLAIIDQEIEALLKVHGSKKRIELKKEFLLTSKDVRGDSHLLQRLFRNALENAFHFAREKIEILITEGAGKKLEILVRDDGPGLPQEILSSFGERKVSRALNSSSDGRLSLGLGSVIMKKVVQVHGGHISIANRSDLNGNVMGADLRIALP